MEKSEGVGRMNKRFFHIREFLRERERDRSVFGYVKEMAFYEGEREKERKRKREREREREGGGG